ncbi:MAG: antibiotic biosynthesis monooxygenase [Planctomycetes bacterium]|nr:antibiotic biosynthesis monooxygenase [Planctomycetota bacterium]
MFAKTPTPPYVAVIFTTTREEADDGYVEAAAKMEELVQGQSGYLGLESVRDTQGLGITVSYWANEASAQAWRVRAEHAAVRAVGRERWYSGWRLRVAVIHREESS